MPCDQLMLCSHIVIERNFREWLGRGMIRRRRGLTVPKKCGNDDEILEGVNLGPILDGIAVISTCLGFRALSSPISQTLSDIAVLFQLLYVHNPIVDHTSGIPRWVHNRGRHRISEGLISDVGVRDGFTALEFPVSKRKGVKVGRFRHVCWSCTMV